MWPWSNFTPGEFMQVGRHEFYREAVRERALELIELEMHVPLLKTMQLLRDFAERPMILTNAAPSGIRTPELNRVCGGSPTSQHLLFQAADWTFGAGQSDAMIDFCDWLVYCDHYRHLWHQVRVYERSNFCHLGVAVPGIDPERSHYRVEYSDGRVVMKLKAEL